MSVLRLFVNAGFLWFRRDAINLAAATSYFAIFALVPFFVLSIILVGYVFGEDVVASIFLSWGAALGENVIEFLVTAVTNLRQLSQNVDASILGTILFLSVIITGFNTVGRGFETLWSPSGEPPKTGWVTRQIRSVMFIIFLQIYIALLIGVYGSLLRVLDWFPVGVYAYSLFQIIALALIFTIAFSVLASGAPRFKSLLMGGFVSAVLFTFAKYAVDLYLGTTPVTGVYESAGLIIVLLAWVYVSAAILFYGAAFAFEHAKTQY